ncbi:MAG: sorbosone dehydrogenase [Betaproteobacteria bacterium HGW-Betaproteobacteria-11]|nr:MAG: sorbosone dehydrogenase [Betaproteobacteria bacterium HGW-Betaproteobacteria-11]
MRFAPFRPHLWFIVLVAWLMPTSPVLAEDALPLEKIRLPPGFSIALWTRVDNPRQMALGARDATGGTVYVGSMRAGRVHAVRFDSRHQASGVSTVASGLTLPSGVAWRDGALYVAAVDRILRYADIDRRLANPPAPVVVRNTLPRQNEHGWKFIAFGPDGKLYVPVGAPCNSCAPGEPYASILRMDADGSNAEIYARGVRNSIGFDWDPADGTLWFTDNGRDWLGPDAPPDELNHAPRPGLDFGFPFCHGGEIADPDFGKARRCDEFIPPAQKLGAHVAALGMRFYVGNQFPEAYRHSIFIAEHGSWNRWQKVGYRITRVPIRNGKAAGYEVFAEGWLEDSLLGGSAWGRPSDVLALPDGSLLVADDQANAIYRISWRGR